MRKLLLTYILSCLSFFSFGQKAVNPDFPKGSHKQNYDPGVVVVKLKENSAFSKLEAAFNRKDQKKPIRISKAHPHLFHKNKRKKFRSSFGLDRVYKLQLSKDQDVFKVIERLQRYDFIEYAEPYYRMELLYVPNDPEADSVIGRQDHLDLIKAYDAWEVEKGDSTVVLGVLDTGANLNHEDLKDNIYLNEADPINGIDDDGDGYLDNYKGWDFADKDNDPSAVHDHGTKVSGIATARTDNAKGIAGMGFNTKLMPIKVYTNVGTWFQNGYDAILYAAEKGCKVINISWGSANSYSQYAQDIINTAVLDMDLVIIAAAGNSNLNEEFYPASYEYVMSVANAQKTDEKAEGSTFSPYVDISAPGIQIMTTSGNNLYGPAGGTSMASPAVAGTAALIRARYPELNALQVIERLRVTADDIYDVGDNAQYKELLGKGRLNMFQALVDSTSPSVRFIEKTYFNNIGNYAFYDDTVFISGKFVSYLNTVSNLKVTLSVNSSYVEMIDSVYEAPYLPTLASDSTTFIIHLKKNMPPGEKLRFRLGFEGDNYQDYQYFDINTEPDYVTIDNGKLAMTVGSNGNLGYNSDQFNDGTGITYNGNFVLDFASLIIGKNEERISDNMFNSYYTLERAKDFEIVESIKIDQDDSYKIKASSRFSDTGAANPLGIAIKQAFSSFKSADQNNFLLLDYQISNQSGSMQDSLRVGLYTDWDIVDSMNNRAGFDADYRLGYVFYPDENIYAGIALLSDLEVGFQSIKLYDESWNFVFGPDISEDEKYSLLKDAGDTYETGPSNVATTLSALLYNIPDNETVSVQFAITAGNSLEELQENIAQATLSLQPFIVLPNENFCMGDSIIVNPNLGENIYFYSDSLLTNLIGQGSFVKLDASTKNCQLYMKKKGLLFYEKFKTAVQVEDKMEAAFSMSKESIVLEEDLPVSSLDLMDETECAVRWEWQVNGKVAGHNKTLSLLFDSIGTYQIKLKAWNKVNTLDSVTQIVEVLMLNSFFITTPPLNFCIGDNVYVDPNLGENLYFYSDSLLTDSLGEGDHIQLEQQVTTDLYITRRNGLYYEKFKTTVQVEEMTAAKFSMATNNITLDENNVADTLLLIDESQCAARWEWTLNNKIISEEPNPTLILDKPGIYGIKLKVWNKINTVDSTIQVLVVDRITGIASGENTDFTAYPNPVSDYLSINLPIANDTEVILTDQLGRTSFQKVIRPTTKPYQLEVASFTSGLYFLHIKTAEKSYFHKIIVK